MTTKSRKDPATATGTVHGRVITLDLPVPELEGCRVRVLLRPAEEPEIQLGHEQQAALWRDWVEHGAQGPLDDGEEGFP